jgi:hypothetical protein
VRRVLSMRVFTVSKRDWKSGVKWNWGILNSLKGGLGG